MLRYITLPLLRPFILLAATFRVMNSLRIFDVIYATTAGGPDDATATSRSCPFSIPSSGIKWALA